VSAHATAVPRDGQINSGLVVFLNEASTTVRTRVQFTAQPRIQVHSASELDSRSATVSEIQQAIALADGQTDITISRGVDIFCVSPTANLPPFEWFLGILRDALLTMEHVEIRLHCFGVLSDEQSEIVRWKPKLEYFRRFHGGAYLLSSSFQGVRLDRIRSYALLARLVEVFALTGTSRIAPQECFSVRRETSPFQVYVAGLESFASPPYQTAAEYLLDSMLWDELGTSLPILTNDIASRFNERTVEHWLLRAAASSSSLEEMVLALRAHRSHSPWIGEVALDLQSAIVNLRRDQPKAERLHALEQVVIPYEDHTMLTAARHHARSIFDVFPFPIHPFFLRTPPRTEAAHRIAAERVRQRDILAKEIRKNFYAESLRRHREWLPPMSAAQTDVSNVAAAYDIRNPGSSLLASCHLDPAISGDLREELCPGSDRIQFLHLMPV
jgi:hypothetical protein